MNTESYTPGHSQNSTNFMAARSVGSHGQFFMPHLKSGVSVLDCGCGPGKVVGVDFGVGQIAGTQSSAARRGIANVNFLAADSYSLPFAESSFDRVFSHALMEHLADPLRAVKELHRVLKPGGVIGVCSPDWGGFVLAPPSDELNFKFPPIAQWIGGNFPVSPHEVEGICQS